MKQGRPTRLYIDGIGFWSPGLTDWASACDAFTPNAPAPSTRGSPERPTPGMLCAAEQRRAPGTVALALEVAAAAVRSSGHAAANLTNVFASAHGDLTVNTAMCDTLARAPQLVSPIKFIHSVHNAAAGHWSIATGCHQANTALGGSRATFASGLFEAVVQCVADERPTLLVAYDMEAAGPLADAIGSRGTLGFALVLSPFAGTRSIASLQTWLEVEQCDRTGARGSDRPGLRSAAAQALAGCGIADALPLIEALATLGIGAVDGENAAHGAEKFEAEHDVIYLPLSSSLRLKIIPARSDATASNV